MESWFQRVGTQRRPHTFLPQRASTGARVSGRCSLATTRVLRQIFQGGGSLVNKAASAPLPFHPQEVASEVGTGKMPRYANLVHNCGGFKAKSSELDLNPQPQPFLFSVIPLP